MLGIVHFIVSVTPSNGLAAMAMVVLVRDWLSLLLPEREEAQT